MNYYLIGETEVFQRPRKLTAAEIRFEPRHDLRVRTLKADMAVSQSIWKVR